MPNAEVKTKKEYIFLVAVILTAAFLLFPNLGQKYLWQDEAQTALLARSVLQNGYPKAFDSQNSFSMWNGYDMDPKTGAWKWHQWLPFYATALSFKLLGESNYSARLTSVLCGLALTVVVYYLGLALWGNAGAARAGVLSLLFYVPFLLYARQARYYIYEIFFCATALHAYLLCLKKLNFSRAIYLALSLLLLYHSMHAHFYAVLTAMLVHMAFTRTMSALMIALLSGVTLINLAFQNAIYSMPLGVIKPPIFHPSEIPVLAWQYAIYIFRDYLSPVLIAVVLAAVLLNRKQADKAGGQERQGLIFILIFGFSVLSVMLAVSPLAYYRNLAPIVIVCVLLAGMSIERIWRMNKFIAVAAFIAFVLYYPFPSYIKEITQKYISPMKVLTEYLSSNSKAGDTAIVTVEDMPLKYYTKLRIYGGTTGESLEEAKNARFIITRSLPQLNRMVSDFVSANIDPSKYETVYLEAPDGFFDNREELREHVFGSRPGPRMMVLVRSGERALAKQPE